MDGKPVPNLITGGEMAHINPGQRPLQPMLTAEQDRFVAALFEKYIPADFSAEDAREIIGALEDQGLRGPGGALRGDHRRSGR